MEETFPPPTHGLTNRPTWGLVVGEVGETTTLIIIAADKTAIAFVFG